jgi:hypothetical protein
VIVSTDQEKWRYRSLGFLISHRNAELPCFHSIFSKSELRLKFTDPAGVRALFRLLQRQFPGVEMLDIPNMFGANSLHCTVCRKLLLNLAVTDGIVQTVRRSRHVAERLKAEMLPHYTGKSVV